MTAPRRVGAETSKTRLVILDAVERLLAKTGYAGVTYRVVATEASVTPGLVQYYFPSLDEVFIAVIRRRSEENLTRLTEALQACPEQPLRVLWEYSRDESTAAVTTEFLALGNHRPSIRSEIAMWTERVRALQLQALAAHQASPAPLGAQLTMDALLFLLTGTPKLIRLERGVGLSSAHDDVVAGFEAYLDVVEPGVKKPKSRR